MNCNIYNVAIEFYESNVRWGGERLFKNIIVHYPEGELIKLVDINHNVIYVPLNNNIANITVTLNEKGE